MFSYKLSEGEKPVRFLRQNPSVLFGSVVLTGFLICVPVWYLGKYSLLRENLNYIIFFSTICLFFLFYKILLWYLQIVLVTDKKLVVFNYKNLARREITELPFLLISSIEIKKKNVLNLFLDLNSLEVKLAGNSKSHILKNLSKISETEKLLKILWSKTQNA